MTCEPADRQGCGGCGRGRRREAAAQPFLSLWVHGSAQRPGSAAPRGDGCRPAQLPSPLVITRKGARSAPTRGPGSPPPRLLLSRPGQPAAPSPFSPTLLRSAGGGSPKVVLKTQRLGGKKGNLQPSGGRGAAGWGGVRGELNIGALFPFPGRDMINRFLLI